MPKKLILIITLLALIFSIFIIRVYNLAYKEKEYYLNQARNINEVYVTGSSAPRGRILDINGNVLVDNIGVNTVFYHKPSNITLKEELNIAEALAKLTNFEYEYSESKLKDFYMIKYSNEVDLLITSEEYELYNERKLTSADLEQMKLERITDEMLNKMTDLEKHSSYFYFLMNDGYSYDNKCLMSDVSDKVYASIIEANLPGVFGEMEWKRVYLYDDTLKTIFGSISNSLPKEKEYLLSEGYSLTDKVGISGLE